MAAAGWAAYFRQGTLLPGLALALLYLTVLSLGFLMTAFLAHGLPESTISLFRSAGALAGLLATVVVVPLQRCGIGLVAAGGLGIMWQVRLLWVSCTLMVS
jgi:iron-regulated transporter 1